MIFCSQQCRLTQSQALQNASLEALHLVLLKNSLVPVAHGILCIETNLFREDIEWCSVL